MIAVLLAIEDEALDAPGPSLVLLRAVGVVAVLGAAFVLDDEAATTLEASPSTLAWRRFLRGAASVALVIPPWGVAVWRLDTHATRLPVVGLTLELFTLLVLALAIAAAVTRWSGSIDPGVAATPAVLLVVLGAFQLPTRFALYGAPGPGWGADHVRWLGVFVAATLVLLWCGRDPEARRLIQR
jgi:hypothetical protein